MSMHTKEPWRASRRSVVAGEGDNMRIVAEPFSNGMEGPVLDYLTMQHNARRIAACVNACAGLDVRGLEVMVASGETVASRAEVQQQLMAELTEGRKILRGRCDDLLSALEGLIHSAECFGMGVSNDAYVSAVSAVAALKGGAV